MNNTNDTKTGLASLLEGTTPGPWQIEPCFMIAAKNGDYVCTIDASEGRAHHANARLIAAAPALAASHAALVAALESLRGRCWQELDQSDTPNGKVNGAILGRVRKALSDARNLTAGMEGGRK